MFKKIWNSNINHDELPESIISLTIDWLRLNDAALCLGIFRISGAQKELDQLKQTAIKKPKSGFKIFQGHSVHNVAGLLKLYFRSLEPPILTFDLFEAWISAIQIQSRIERHRCLRKCLASLPQSSFNLLNTLIEYLVVVASHAQFNKMDSKNLAIVFGPSLLRSPLFDPLTALQQNQYAIDLVVEFIDHFGTLFNVFGKPIFAPASPPSSPREHSENIERDSHPEKDGPSDQPSPQDKRMSSLFENALRRGSLRMSIQHSIQGILDTRGELASPAEQEEDRVPGNAHAISSPSPAAELAASKQAPLSPQPPLAKKDVDIDHFFQRLSHPSFDLNGLSAFMGSLSDDQLTSFIVKMDDRLGYAQPPILPTEARRQSQILEAPLPQMALSCPADSLSELAKRLFEDYALQCGLDLQSFRLFYRHLCSEIQEICPWSVRDIDELFANMVGRANACLTGSESVPWPVFDDWFAKVLRHEAPFPAASSEPIVGSSNPCHQTTGYRPPNMPPSSPIESKISSSSSSSKKLTPIRSAFRSVQREYISLDRLQRGDYPQSLDQEHLEMYLDPQDFQDLFLMPKNRFVLLPYWTRIHLKRRYHLLSKSIQSF